MIVARLLKNAHLRRCAAPFVVQRTSGYASRLMSCAPCIWTFLNSLIRSYFNSYPGNFSSVRWMGRFRSYLCLCKVKISFFASLSAAAGLLLSAQSPGSTLPILTTGVFLVACGACALNHWQERNTDALMARTAGRPIPAGIIKSVHALYLAIILICSGCAVLLSVGAVAPLLGLAAVLWYNGLYTWLKTRTAFAVIPGALVGAIPPAMGWIAGGGSLWEPRLAVISFFFFMWQVPHFFIHMLAFGKEYEEAGLPSLTAVFTGSQLYRLTFQWIIAAAVSLQFVILFGLIQSPIVRISLFAASLWLAMQGINFMRVRELGYITVFRRINYFMFIVMLLMFLDKLPAFL
ncbi:MAG TPA: protoheme IX farnesyltransferase [Syntrophales bacterium]|nr:protoheme IX farnesyltransferase [Syntrophales bacterium]